MALEDTREGRALARLFADPAGDLARLRAAMAETAAREADGGEGDESGEG